MWLGTIPGGLFRSVDRGETWELNTALWTAPGREKWMGGGYDHPGIHSILVDPRDSAHVVLGVSTGGVWITDNSRSPDIAIWSVRGIGVAVSVSI